MSLKQLIEYSLWCLRGVDYADSFLQYVRSRSPLAKPAVAGRSTQSYVETP